MSSLAPLPLAYAVALIALIAGLLAWLHFRAAKPIRNRVPFLGAWDEVAPPQSASRATWKVAPSWAFVRALSIAALIVLALAKLAPEWLVGRSRPTLIVLDAGAHMRATDETPSRFERARSLAIAELDRLPLSEEVMIAQLDSLFTPLSSWTPADQREPLMAALRAAEVSFEPTRFSALREFVSEPGRARQNTRVILVSDGAFELPASERDALSRAGVELRQLEVGKSAANLAIRTFSVRAYPWDAERCETLIELENTGAAARDIELTLFEDDRPIDVRPLRLEARSRQRQFLSLGATGTKLSARITPKDGAADAMPLDDQAYAVLAQAPRRRILLVTEGQRYLESALALDPRIEVVKLRPNEYRDADGFDAVIFDRCVPARPASIPVLWLAPNGEGAAPYRVVGSIDRPFFEEAASDDPLLRSVALRDVNIRSAQRVQLEPGDKVVARSKSGPLIVAGARASHRFIALTFDPKESDLVLRTGWPILISQALQQLTAARSVALELPRTLGAELPSVRAPGFYELDSRLSAVNANPEALSNIEPRELTPSAGTSRQAWWQSRELIWMAPLLAAVLLLALEWKLWRIGSRSGLRLWLALLLRASCLLCLCVALFRPQLQRSSARVSLVVAQDVSASIDDAAIAASDATIAKLRAASDDVRVIRFARNAAAALRDASTRLATDLQSAVQRAYGSFTPNRVPNLLFLTDGNETHGDVLTEAARAARLGVRIDFVAPQPGAAPDVAIRALELPPDLAVGVPFTLRADLTAEQSTRVRAQLFGPGDRSRPEATRELDLAAGTTTIDFPLSAKAPGRVEYMLGLQPIAADRSPRNNRLSVAAEVPGPPRILIIDSEPKLAAPLVTALGTRDFAVEVLPPSAAPRRAAEFASYAFVVASDVATRDLRADTQAALRAYVAELGGGFLFSGGARGYGFGSGPASALDQLLPVRATSEEHRDQATLALALIIDCSGSMAGSKLELAREAAALTAQTLADPDLIEVIGFSSQPERRVRLQPASNRASIAQSIARLAATGGTQLYPALDAAYRDLRGAEARLKHAILLTDGQTQEAGIEDLATSMRADGITLSTVGLGSEVNRSLLETIAGLGGGRAYFPLDARNVPQIFMSEATRHKRPSAVDHSTRMFEREHAGFLDGIPLAAAPTLAGYVTTQAKPRPVQVILETDRGDPLLARWRVGLGYALAWTSDLKPRWGTALLRWPSFARFFAQLVREHMRSPALARVPITARVERDRLHIAADALGGSDQFENGLEARARVLSKDGEVAAATLVQTAPAHYETELPWIQTGAFTIEATFQRSGRLQALGHGAVASGPPAELAATRPNTGLLQQVARRTGGRQLPTAAEALDSGGRLTRFREACWPALAWLALGLFLLEQYVRHARVLGRTPAPQSRGR